MGIVMTAAYEQRKARADALRPVVETEYDALGGGWKALKILGAHLDGFVVAQTGEKPRPPLWRAGHYTHLLHGHDEVICNASVFEGERGCGSGNCSRVPLTKILDAMEAAAEEYPLVAADFKHAYTPKRKAAPGPRPCLCGSCGQVTRNLDGYAPDCRPVRSAS